MHLHKSPYNTGKDFVYFDKFNQDKKEYWEDAEITENSFKIDTNTETDGRFHSNWLNMMYSRLLIARQLLKEDGVIFISIDDNEVHHLKIRLKYLGQIILKQILSQLLIQVVEIISKWHNK